MGANPVPTKEAAGQANRLSALVQAQVEISVERAGAAQCSAGSPERSAASTRSATDSPVRPTSSRSSAGLPWVT